MASWELIFDRSTNPITPYVLSSVDAREQIARDPSRWSEDHGGAVGNPTARRIRVADALGLRPGPAVRSQLVELP